jgi:GNAT superfamily N-acetyltransferase
MTVEVRPATPGDDLDEAGRIVHESYLALPDHPHDPEYDHQLTRAAERMADTVVLLAFLDGELVGCLTYVPEHTNPHAEHGDPAAATFRYFGVRPEVQGRGVGAAMVRWCADRARADGLERLRIHTLSTMHGAQRLYAHLGFLRDPERDEDWDGIQGVAYVLHL